MSQAYPSLTWRERFPFSLLYHPINPRSSGLAVTVVSFLLLFWAGASIASRVFLPAADPNEANRLPASCPRFGRRFGVMFDAGSTGSRVHVYDLDYAFDGTVVLRHELFEEVKPGLSSFGGRPDEAAASIGALLTKAVAGVPEALRSCTPVELKATAGLRLLGEGASRELLGAVDALFRASPFFVPRDATIVMDGKDEGPLAWITVNFLLGTIFDSNTNKPAGAAATGGGGSVSPRPVAILDMGGASTQIVFVPNGNPGALRGPAASEHKYTVTVFGKTFDVYQHSHLGYGLKEAGKSIAALATDPAAFECFPPGFQMPAAGGVTVSNAKRQPQSYDKCQRYARKFIKKEASCAAATCSFNGVYQPPLARDFAGGDFFIFSYFYDRMIPFLPEDGVMTVGDYKRIGRKICDSSQLASSPPAVNTDSTSSKKLDAEAAARNLGTECMDFAYLYELLATGYELPDSQVVNIRKKVKGFETAWTLGAMIIAMQ